METASVQNILITKIPNFLPFFLHFFFFKIELILFKLIANKWHQKLCRR